MKQRRPDVEAVMATLKDFQRDSVEYVFDRLYGDDATRRFLVADEVGLGKTLIARGLIAKTIDRLWDTTKRIDIVYICSSGDIARQNIRRLDITGEGVALPMRVTLLPREIGNLKKNRINFIALTPGTSFDLSSHGGMWQERALLYWMLEQAGWSHGGAGAMNVLQGEVKNTAWFRRMLREHPSKYPIDKTLARSFRRALNLRVAEQRALGEPDLKSRYDDLCVRFKRTRKTLPRTDRLDRQRMVGELRSVLAASCLEALEPDLVILDEFQRFKDLLQPDDEAGLLAQRLFEYEEADDHARVVLLSATPYKMYTLSQESEMDDHYRDFLGTLRFLLNDEEKVTQLSGLLDRYRAGLYRLTEGDGRDLRGAKLALEDALRQVMVRTERLAVSSDRDGMLKEIAPPDVPLTAADVVSYVSIDQVARIIGQPDALEFWKSAPYLLNFMDHYRFKKEFVRSSDDWRASEELARPLMEESSLLLPWADVAAYKEIDPGNARLRDLSNQLIGVGAWRLLWVPPAMPHYELRGPYADPSLKGFTKQLVFSSWVVVPRVITCMLSYEAERRMIRSFEQRARNTPNARARRKGLLQFSAADGRLTGMPVLGIMYPSLALAELGDPRTFAGVHGSNLALEQVLQEVRGRIEQALEPVLRDVDPDEPENEQWYWAASILLDLIHHRSEVEAWFGQRALAELWTGSDPGSDDVGSRWVDHVKQAKETAEGVAPSGRPPGDLAEVLAIMAVAGPANCASRAIERMTGRLSGEHEVHARNGAAQVAWAFRTLFNQPETMTLIRGMDRSDSPYWRQVLSYCADGGLQAVLDEYSHFLFEFLGLPKREPDDMTASIAEAMAAPLRLRTPTLRLDEVSVSPEGDIEIEKGRGMRGRFALRFGADPVEGSSEVTREDQVRQAFNSPFWPFVLATTSVGQEGLDFHAYCHSVVHWNLPSNPVDLEQREGRVHRYKGHAVRKNVADDHGAAALASGEADAWNQAFDAARDPSESELTPYWVYAGDAKIERRVPSVPLSRDRDRLEALRKSLAIYRMVFGQPRQDDLVAFLQKHVPPGQIDRHLGMLQVRLDPPARNAPGSRPFSEGELPTSSDT